MTTGDPLSPTVSAAPHPDRAGGDAVARPDDPVVDVSARRVGDAAVMAVRGELDLQTARTLLAEVDAVLAASDVTLLVIDLTEVEFLGSSGLGTLAEIASRVPPTRHGAARPVPVRLVAPPHNRAVIRPWELMHLQEILPLHPHVDQALADRDDH